MTKKIGWATLLIVIAAAIIINALGLFQKISIIGIVILAILAAIFVKGIVKRSWGEIFLPLGFAPYVAIKSGFIPQGEVYDVINQLTPWPLILAALLLSIAFGMIFKGKDHHKFVQFESTGSSYDDAESVKVDNSFSETSKYVNSTNFQYADINNNFGQTNVYFNNAILSKDGAKISVSNSFGETNIHLPNTWRVQVKKDNAFGSTREHGMANADMDAPLVVVNADCNFGEINIYYS